MATFLSEDLNEVEVVWEQEARLVGFDFTSTGVETRWVEFKDGDSTKSVIPVPPGSHVGQSGLFEPYPGGLSVESLRGDGTLIANVYYEPREDVVAAIEELDGPDTPSGE